MSSLGNSSARFHASTFERAMVFASASGRARNLSAHTGANAATTASSDRSFAILLAVLPSVQPPQPKPTAIVATAPMAAPCSRRFSDSPCSIEGTCTVISFARHGSERGYGYPDGFAVELELKTERLGMAYRLVSAYALVRPELSKTAHTDAPASPPKTEKCPSLRSLQLFREGGNATFMRMMCAVS